MITIIICAAVLSLAVTFALLVAIKASAIMDKCSLQYESLNTRIGNIEKLVDAIDKKPVPEPVKRKRVVHLTPENEQAFHPQGGQE